jgi:hypothetical protein
MNIRAIPLALVAVILFATIMGGCAGSSSGKTCQELWAEHKACPPQKWHEENEGPSVYNHFHSTR